MAVATYGCGGWHLTGEMPTKLRTWAFHRLRKIFLSQHQPTKAEYMIKPTAHIDEIRSMNESPHIVHVVLDRYFKNV